MGVGLKIIAINKDNEQKIAYSSADPCDGLALMLKSKNANYRTLQKLNEILSTDEIQTIKCTYDEYSVSVSEGYESFSPEFENPKQLQIIIEKIKRFYIKKMLSDETLNKDNFTEILFDICTLSELYSALEIAKSQDLKIALTLEDF